MRRFGRDLLVGLAAFACLLVPSPAAAWDPATTHQALLDEAVRRSDLHRRWMDASDLQRGVFSAFRVDPTGLDPETRRLLSLAFRLAPADSGAEPLGGPGACPGADAPIETQRYCVAGDRWELDALGWLRLGVLAEAVPAARQQHHFLSAADRGDRRWRDPKAGELRTRRRQVRANGAPWAGLLAASSEGSSGLTAIGWLDDARDPLSPARLRHDLVRAELEPDPDLRNQHVALSLVRAGALLHVVQDAAMPAFARGDKLAFSIPMSTAAGDRGSGLQEHTRLRYGRNELPPAHADDARPIAPFRGTSIRALLTTHASAALTPPAATLAPGVIAAPPPSGAREAAEAVPGESPAERAPQLPAMGLADFAALHFLSDGQLARATALADDTDPLEAAATLLSESGLGPAEVAGATLRGWPGEAGYLVSGTDRALAAWERDEAGRVRLFLDDAVHREASAWLLPLAAEASRAVLDALWPEFPFDAGSEPSSALVVLAVPSDVQQPMLHVLAEDSQGRRSPLQTLKLEPGRIARVTGLPTAPAGTSTVLVFVGQRADGIPFVASWTTPTASSTSLAPATRPPER